jgi:hypothetical protein
MNTKLQTQSPHPTTSDGEAVRHLKEAIASGRHWYIALLEAIGLWQTAEENVDGRRYRYLIDSEAFDWLLLAERLLGEVDGLLPEDERAVLLFHGKPPLKLTADEFKKLIGDHKYRQYLNYFYGVTAEEALIQVVEEEVHKERQSLGFSKKHGTPDEVYTRIYDTSQSELLKRFRREKGYPRSRSTSLTELREFTYWLFKYRLNHCDKARVASDTKKALKWLRSNTTTLDRNDQPEVYGWTE